LKRVASPAVTIICGVNPGTGMAADCFSNAQLLQFRRRHFPRAAKGPLIWRYGGREHGGGSKGRALGYTKLRAIPKGKYAWYLCGSLRPRSRLSFSGTVTQNALSAVAVILQSGIGGQKMLMKDISTWMYIHRANRTGLLIDAMIKV
jgi:hypothetical protein